MGRQDSQNGPEPDGVSRQQNGTRGVGRSGVPPVAPSPRPAGTTYGRASIPPNGGPGATIGAKFPARRATPRHARRSGHRAGPPGGPGCASGEAGCRAGSAYQIGALGVFGDPGHGAGRGVVAGAARPDRRLAVRRRGTEQAATRAPEPAPTPVLAAAGAGGTAPSAAGIKAAVASLVDAPALGSSVNISIVDAATGTALYEKNSGTPTTPASTTKLRHRGDRAGRPRPGLPAQHPGRGRRPARRGRVDRRRRRVARGRRGRPVPRRGPPRQARRPGQEGPRWAEADRAS